MHPPPPFLVTLGLDAPTFGRLDALRDRYFPPALNQVPAHVSLFHHLPGDEFETIDRALGRAARSSPPLELTFPTVKRLGRGMMLPVEAEGLAGLHARLARDFARWLTPQDRQPFRPHVTIMNKADRAEVEAAWAELAPGWSAWTGRADRVILWRYLGGPWAEVETYSLAAGPVAEVFGRKTDRVERPEDPGDAPR